MNGSADITLSITACEISTAMQNTGTGVLNTSGVFDAWAVNVAGTLTLCVATNGAGGGWASDTGNTQNGTNTQRAVSSTTPTPPAGYTQLDTTTRPYITNKWQVTHCYNGATDEGPIAVNQATYLGTIFTTAAGQTSYTFGGIGALGTAGLFGVWNAYNRVNVSTMVGDTASTWTYALAAVRAANASPTMRVSYVRGLAEDSSNFRYYGDAQGTSGVAVASIGLCYNVTNAFSGTIAGNQSFGGLSAEYTNTDLGFNFVNACEFVNVNSAVTFYGQNTYSQNGLIFQGRM